MVMTRVASLVEKGTFLLDMHGRRPEKQQRFLAIYSFSPTANLFLFTRRFVFLTIKAPLSLELSLEFATGVSPNYTNSFIFRRLQFKTEPVDLCTRK